MFFSVIEEENVREIEICTPSHARGYGDTQGWKN